MRILRRLCKVAGRAAENTAAVADHSVVVNGLCFMPKLAVRCGENALATSGRVSRRAAPIRGSRLLRSGCDS